MYRVDNKTLLEVPLPDVSQAQQTKVTTPAADCCSAAVRRVPHVLCHMWCVSECIITHIAALTCILGTVCLNLQLLKQTEQRKPKVHAA